jgi:hypothetical protein
MSNNPQVVTVPAGGVGNATPVGLQFQGTIMGRVFQDVDGDGVESGPDAGLAGIEVAVTPLGHSPLFVLTAVSGDFRALVPVGDVEVEIAVPPGAVVTTNGAEGLGELPITLG